MKKTITISIDKNLVKSMDELFNNKSKYVESLIEKKLYKKDVNK